jgi:hypothetical protein
MMLVRLETEDTAGNTLLLERGCANATKLILVLLPCIKPNLVKDQLTPRLPRKISNNVMERSRTSMVCDMVSVVSLCWECHRIAWVTNKDEKSACAYILSHSSVRVIGILKILNLNDFLACMVP